MKILVTGANGYLGRGIVTELLNCGANVIATDISGDGIDSRARRVECNLFDTEGFTELWGKVDILVHLAWRDGFKHDSFNHIADLPSHCRFIESACKAGVKKIVVMGSMHEVGFWEGSINSSTPCNPLSYYGISKNALRQACFLMTKEYGIQLVWLRGFYIVGNLPYGNSIFSKIIQASERGDKSFPFTMGRNQFDFLDYPVFCKQVSAAVLRSDMSEIINCCSGYPQKLADRVEQFIKDNDLNIELQYGIFPDRPYDSKAIWGDNMRIAEIMNEE